MNFSGVKRKGKSSTGRVCVCVFFGGGGGADIKKLPDFELVTSEDGMGWQLGVYC